MRKGYSFFRGRGGGGLKGLLCDLRGAATRWPWFGRLVLHGRAQALQWRSVPGRLGGCHRHTFFFPCRLLQYPGEEFLFLYALCTSHIRRCRHRRANFCTMLPSRLEPLAPPTPPARLEFLAPPTPPARLELLAPRTPPARPGRERLDRRCVRHCGPGGTRARSRAATRGSDPSGSKQSSSLACGRSEGAPCAARRRAKPACSRADASAAAVEG